MAKKGHSEEQILRALRQAEGGARVAEICREHGISEAWKKKYSGLRLNELRELRQLREENSKLKRGRGVRPPCADSAGRISAVIETTNESTRIKFCEGTGRLRVVFRLLQRLPEARRDVDVSLFAAVMDRLFWDLLGSGCLIMASCHNRKLPSSDDTHADMNQTRHSIVRTSRLMTHGTEDDGNQPMRLKPTESGKASRATEAALRFCLNSGRSD